MKKTWFLLLITLFSLQAAFATSPEMIHILDARGNFSIQEPNGAIYNYKKDDLLSVPQILYGSIISGKGGSLTVMLFDSFRLHVEKNQSAFITKDPITEAFIITENKPQKNNPMKLVFSDSGSVVFDSGSVISVLKKGNTAYLKIIRATGRVRVTQEYKTVLEKSAWDENDGKVRVSKEHKTTDANEGNMFEFEL